MIQEILAHLWKAKKVSTPILYGGSVNTRNAASFISQKGGAMHGMLVGGASLKPKEFIEIVRSSAIKR
jgi:triosephosphate isomerase